MISGLVKVRVRVLGCMGTPRFLAAVTVGVGQHSQLRQGANSKLNGVLTFSYLRNQITTHQIRQQPRNNHYIPSHVTHYSWTDLQSATMQRNTLPCTYNGRRRRC